MTRVKREIAYFFRFFPFFLYSGNSVKSSRITSWINEMNSCFFFNREERVRIKKTIVSYLSLILLAGRSEEIFG